MKVHCEMLHQGCRPQVGHLLDLWYIHMLFTNNFLSFQFAVDLMDVVFMQQSPSTDATLFDRWKFVGKQTDCPSKTVCHAGPARSLFSFRHSGSVFAPLTGLSELFVTALFSDHIGCPLWPSLFTVRNKWCQFNLLLSSKLSALWMNVCFLLSNFNDRKVHIHIVLLPSKLSKSECYTHTQHTHCSVVLVYCFV